MALTDNSQQLELTGRLLVVIQVHCYNPKHTLTFLCRHLSMTVGRIRLDNHIE